jgi:hypothetical protein
MASLTISAGGSCRQSMICGKQTVSIAKFEPLPSPTGQSGELQKWTFSFELF